MLTLPCAPEATGHRQPDSQTGIESSERLGKHRWVVERRTDGLQALASFESALNDRWISTKRC